MLTSVKVYNPQGSLLTLPMNGTSEYFVKGISGLGPVKETIITTEYANVPGGVYQGSKENMRNVVILLGYNPSYTTADPFGTLRRALYPWFLSGTKVRVQFVSDNLETVEVTGYVEDMLPTIFTDKPEAQISILCPDPYFYSLITTASSSLAGDGTRSLTNNGQVAVGMNILVTRLYVISGIEFLMTQTAPITAYMQYNGARLTEFMVLKLCTIPGQKSAEIMYMDEYDGTHGAAWTLRGGDLGWLSILGYMTNWLKVEPGVNDFTIDTTPSAVTNINFVAKYKGL